MHVKTETTLPDNLSSESSVEEKINEIEPFKPPPNFYASFISLSLLALSCALTTTSLGTTLVEISNDLSLSLTETFWLPASTYLASAVVHIVCAALSDILGRKTALAIGGLVLAEGHQLAAFAQSSKVLLTGRALQGAGMGITITLTDIIVADMVPLQFRGQWLSFVSVPWAIGGIIGPLIGAGLAHINQWRWVFGLNVPICLIGVVLALWKLPSLPQCESPLQRLKTLDFVGLWLFCSSIIPFLVALMQAGIKYPWSDPRTFLTIAFGGVGFAGFILWELFGAKDPFVPLRDFKERSCVLGLATTLVHGAIVGPIGIFLPLYFRVARQYSIMLVGVFQLPGNGATVIATFAIGILIGRYGCYRWSLWAGWSLVAIGTGLLQLLTTETTPAIWATATAAGGLGIGFLYSGLGFVVIASVGRENTPMAVSLYAFSRALGTGFGLAISTVLFQHQVTHYLQQEGLGNARHFAMQLLTSTATGDNVMASSVPDIVNRSLKPSWLAITVTAAMGLVLTAGIRAFPLDQTKRQECEEAKINV